MLHLVQALTRSRSAGSPRLWVITAGAQHVAAAESRVAVGASVLWGLGKVIALEHPELRCTRVDLGLADPATEAQDLIAELATDDPEQEIALRGGRRHVQRLTPKGGDVRSWGEITLEAEGTYLVTGGLGGLGLVVARWMAARGARHLLLLGRRPPSAEAQRDIEALGEMGVRVVVEQGDVADAARLADVLGEARRTLPPLRGVVHAAGTLDDALLVTQDIDRFRAVMAPKVRGALNLHAETRSDRLDLFVTFSSAAAILGSPGQGSYAAANAFMDALAHHRRALGLPAVSVDWGPWSEVGMATRGRHAAADGLGALSPAEGVEALEQMLGTDVGQIVVTSHDARQWCRAHPRLAALPLLAEVAGEEVGAPATPSDGAVRRALLAAEPGPRRRAVLESYLLAEVADVLRSDGADIDTQTPLLDLGFDSLMVVELRDRLETALEVTLSGTIAFNHPTIAALALHLGEQMGIALEAANGDAAEGTRPRERRAEEARDRIERLSDAEVEALLLERLEGGTS